MKRLTRALILIGAAGSIASAQTASWDTSGNGMLNGTYYFRQVLWAVGDNSGSLGEAASLFGTITFTPSNGTFAIAGQIFDAAAGASQPQNFNQSGSYSIAASGYGFMDNVLAAALGATGDKVFGLVSSQGIFIGSATENVSGYNDLFIAAPIGPNQATAATLNGNYAIIDIDNPTGQGLDSRDALFTFTATGTGNLNNVTGLGYVGINGGTVTRQSFSSAVKYTFSNGAGNITFGGTLSDSNLIAGNHYIYISPDGNFVFGGSPQGWDMFVGVRVGTGTPNFNGLYYQAGLDLDLSDLVDGNTTPDSYYGSLKAIPGGTILGHQRISSAFNAGAYDFTYSDFFTFNTDGTSDDGYTAQHYIYGANGAIRIGFGNDPFLAVSVALQAPSFNGSGVFIDPSGITNSASTALFTSSLAPGELVTIYGSNLSSVTDFNTPGFPLIMDGVQVKVNGLAAPIQLVAPGFITFMVPYEITGDVVAIQVVNKGTPSNTVTTFLGLTAPGVFTIPAGGLGSAYARKVSDNSVISATNPVNVGDTMFVGVTGLGAVSPSIADGAPGPSLTLSAAVNSIDVFFNDANGNVTEAPPTFAGLTPTVIGLYQINFQVPAGVASGPGYLEISGPDSYNSEASIQIGTAGTAMAAARPTAHAHRPSPRTKRKTRPFPTTRIAPLRQVNQQ